MFQISRARVFEYSAFRLFKYSSFKQKDLGIELKGFEILRMYYNISLDSKCGEGSQACCIKRGSSLGKLIGIEGKWGMHSDAEAFVACNSCFVETPRQICLLACLSYINSFIALAIDSSSGLCSFVQGV